MFGNIKKQLDEIFGPPSEAIKNIRGLSDSLKELAESVKGIDESKFKSIGTAAAKMDSKQLAVVLEILKELRSPGGVLEILKMVICLDKETRKDILQITANIQAITKQLPKDIPLTEVFQGLKQK